ncbi:MAG TPA: hypothetical protein VHU19_14060 [Pyrinomonadaceae bacterium]|jgi:hypothetical protein|nr:hypothetical protein [Pyrinomonadaceae bacterium]
MIQVKDPKVWQRAADRLRKEPQSIRRHESGLWLVTNKVKNNTYTVRLTRKDGKTFIECGCEAGYPSNHRHEPMPCKHAAALIIFLRAVREMRRRASH